MDRGATDFQIEAAISKVFGSVNFFCIFFSSVLYMYLIN